MAMSIYDYLSERQDNIREPLYMTLGIVTSIDDPDKQNRVKVRLINRDNSNYETDFIRTMTPMSGKAMGFYFLPEVGDEVIVVFCDGDISRPYVIGSLWNMQNPFHLNITDKKNDIRMIKTKSGHTLVFGDENDNTHVTLTTVKELSLTIDDKEESITLKDKSSKNIAVIDSKNNEIKLNADSKITLDVKGNKIEINGNNITLSCKGKLSLDAQDIEIKAKNNATISGTNVNLSANANADIKGQAKVDVSASGPVNVKGAIVKLN